MKGIRLALVVFVLACVASSLAVPSALARGHLDRSFGKHGVIDVRGALGKRSLLGGIEVGSHGEIYFTEEETGACHGGGECLQRVHLRRYRADGRLDRGFGRVLVGEADNWGALVVDSADRPVVAYEHGAGIVLRRFLAGGRPDPTIGQAGSAFLPCGEGCFLDSIEPEPHGGLLFLGTFEPKKKPYRLSRWYIARLRGNGSFDRSFAHAGVLQRRMPNFYAPAASVKPDGGALLYGFGCCNVPEETIYVRRLTPGGTIPRRFGVAADRALAGLHSDHFQEFSWERLSAVEGRGGSVTIFNGGEWRTVEVGLRPDGSRDRSFGKDGVRRLGYEVSEAVSDSRGGAFFAAYLPRAGYKAGRFTPDGRFDHRFGWVELPGAVDEEGMSVFSRGKHWEIVYSPGLPFCRSGCEAEPKLYRIVG